MTTLIKRDPNRSATNLPAPPYEPFRVMRDLMRWDPFRESSGLMPDFSSGFSPSFDVKETPGSYVFKADMPGIKDQDLDISLMGNRLTVSGKREADKKEDNETYHSCERSFGSFTRSFVLPEEVEPAKVDAELRSGVLTLTVIKSPAAQPRKIQVKS